MKGTIRQVVYLAAALALTAVTFDRIGSSSGVQAQVFQLQLDPIQLQPLQLAPAKPTPIDSFASAVRQTAAIAEGVITDIKYDYSEAEGPWTTVILSNARAIAGQVP